MKDPEYIKICPKCKSINVSIQNKIVAGFLPVKYFCNKCKYSNYIFPEINTNKLGKKK